MEAQIATLGRVNRRPDRVDAIPSPSFGVEPHRCRAFLEQRP